MNQVNNDIKVDKLVKRKDRYDLYDELSGHKIASTLDGCNFKLSLKNCEAIELGYDLDVLAYDFSWNHQSDPNYGDTINIFKSGFQKALELMGDKKYTEKQMLNMFLKGDSLSVAIKSKIIEDKPISDIFNKAIQSLQQTEWDVQVVKENVYLLNTGETEMMPVLKPKLDYNGCLILNNI